jgi:Uncharacterized conserved protein H4 (DUF2046).
MHACKMTEQKHSLQQQQQQQQTQQGPTTRSSSSVHNHDNSNNNMSSVSPPDPNRPGYYNSPLSPTPSTASGRRPSHSHLAIPPLLSGSSPISSANRIHHLGGPPTTTPAGAAAMSYYSSYSSPPLSPHIPPPATAGMTAATDILTGITPSSLSSTSSSFSSLTKAQQSAVDTALANEKRRIQNLETHEKDYTTLEEYKTALKRERQHSKHLAMELACLKCVAVTSTLEAEIHEEGRINCLMRRLDGLQKEKGRIILELEREEEMVSV